VSRHARRSRKHIVQSDFAGVVWFDAHAIQLGLIHIEYGVTVVTVPRRYETGSHLGSSPT
jgi:hypothetical protein